MLILAIVATSVAAAFTANGFDYSATSADNVTATICIGGTVPVNTWIGLGLPPRNPAVGMGGADISIAFADDSSKPALIHGKGMLADRPMFSPDQDGSFETLNAAKSSYTGGVLKVCFDRPIAQPSGSLTGNTVPTGSYSFLWATGKTSNGRALQHASTDRGLIFNVTLFGDAATSPPSTAVPTASVATASPSATGKSSSSEKKDLALAVFFGFAALLT